MAIATLLLGRVVGLAANDDGSDAGGSAPGDQAVVPEMAAEDASASSPVPSTDVPAGGGATTTSSVASSWVHPSR